MGKAFLAVEYSFLYSLGNTFIITSRIFQASVTGHRNTKPGRREVPATRAHRLVVKTDEITDN